MRTRENPMLVSFEELPKSERWSACVCALKDEYTITLKDMCKILKCSRAWATRFLKPYLHYIYLSNGAGRSANYLRAANMVLDRSASESTWYSKKEFIQFIKDHITDVTRQTISIPVEMLISSSKLDSFKKSFIPYSEIIQRFRENKDAREYGELLEKREAAIKDCATKKGRLLWDDMPSKYKRSDSPFVACKLKDFDITKLMSVHDLKGYGDSDEEIYRDIFIHGYYRVVLEIPDVYGVISKKVYYLPPNDMFDEEHTMEMVLVKYSNYVRKKSNINYCSEGESM